MTARRHAQHPDGEPVNVGQPAPVAAKAAAIDAAQARPLTWKTIVKRALAVAVAGVALYLVLPALIKVLGEWPRLSTLNPAWFTVCLAAELASFICNFALQRLALRTKGWLHVVTAGANPQPSMVLLAYAAAGIVALFPLTPGGLGIVEASLSGLLILAGVRPAYAVLATLAYRIASYWLPLLAGPPAYLLFRHRYGQPVPRRAMPGTADQPSAGG